MVVVFIGLFPWFGLVGRARCRAPGSDRVVEWYRRGIGVVDGYRRSAHSEPVGIGVLGPLTIEGDVGLSPRDRVVLAVLALRPGESVSAERLADALWGDRPPASGAKILQGCIVRLRKSLGAASIETTSHGYRLAVPPDDVDARRFERLLRRGQELVTLGEPERAAYTIDEALRLWRGRAFIDLEDWEDGRVEAGRLEELRLEAEDVRLDAALRAGNFAEVLAELPTRVAAAPLRERRWALLATAQYQAGRQGDALRSLHEARRVLVDELGLDPGPELVALEQAILRQDPALVAASALPEPSTTCPYLGLVPYDVDGRRRLLRARRRGRGLSEPAVGGWRARGGRTLGQREVVAGASRAWLPRCNATAVVSWWSLPVPVRWMRSPRCRRQVRCRCSSSTSARRR